MGKLNPLLYILLLCIVSMTACKDDDASGPKVEKNTFSIDNKTYPLNQGIYFKDQSGTSDNYTVFLSSASGDGIVIVSLNTARGQESFAGTYTAASGNEANTFNAAIIGTDCEDPGDGRGPRCDMVYNRADPPTGRINIRKSGNVYVVDFDIAFENELQGLGNYEGSIFNAE